MGYTTEFSGIFSLDRPLEPHHAAYLRQFHYTRRMARDVQKLQGCNDPLRRAVYLPLGVQGEFFVGDTDFRGQGSTDDILSFNDPPETQPGLWCKWEPTESNDGIQWDGEEKFYAYVGWLNYIVDNFLKRWDYVLNGRVTWQGEEPNDIGEIVAIDNNVFAGNPPVIPPLLLLAKAGIEKSEQDE